MNPVSRWILHLLVPDPPPAVQEPLRLVAVALFFTSITLCGALGWAVPRRRSCPHPNAYFLTAPLHCRHQGRRHVRGDPPTSRNIPESSASMAAFDEETFADSLLASQGTRARFPGNAPVAGGIEPSASPVSDSSQSRARHETRNPGPGTASSRAALLPPPPPGAPVWMHGLRRPDIPFHWNDRVMRYLRFYHDTKRGRSILRSWFRAMGRYEELIHAYLRRAGLPQDLIYVAMIESGFRPTTSSYAGAGGLWQFMPAGGRIYGLRSDYWIDERKDPLRSTMAAVRYLADLYHRFGDWHLALAAFNAGYGAILRSMRMFNTNDYWELCRMESGLPYATTNYVPKILAVAVVGHNLSEFGLEDLEPLPPWRFEVVTIPGPISLKRLARLAGTRYEKLVSLNPALRRGRIPPGYKRFQIRIPTGTSGRLLATVTKLRGFAGRYRLHRMRWGETLGEVAAAYHTTERSLRRLNGIRSSLELRPGVLLLVRPGRGGSHRPRSKNSDRLLAAVPMLATTPPGKKLVFYRTLHGDSISALARVFDVKPSQVVEWNLVTPRAKLPSGLVLRFYVRKNLDLSQVKTYGPGDVDMVEVDSPAFRRVSLRRRGLYRISYRVRRKQPLKRLARRFGMSAGSLARINRISRFSQLAPGQRIVLYVRDRRLRRMWLARIVQWSDPVATPQERRSQPGVSGKTAPTKTKNPTGRKAGKAPRTTRARKARRPPRHRKMEPRAVPGHHSRHRNAP